MMKNIVIFAEWPKSHESGESFVEELTDTVDGVSGEQEVANKFKEVYEALYNCTDTSKEMETINDRISSLIREQM